MQQELRGEEQLQDLGWGQAGLFGTEGEEHWH